ncbi:MAG: HAMP domain-containing histidine kinase [Deltaproteobacteria bacterium]|nr:HAMP domain-containing histidine kinase [Deltaproteobacteria bacterium]
MDVGETNDDVVTLRAKADSLQAQLDQAHQSTHEFVAMLAHELRTPLGAILMWAHVLRMGREGDRQTALDAIESSARVQSKLIGNLLDVTRALAGRLRIDRLPIDLTESVRRSIEEMQASIEAKSVELNVLTAKPPVNVRGDVRRLQEMISTLVRHAIDASPPGGVIDVELKKDGNRARITVRDGGAELSADQYAQLFAAFRLQGDSAHRVPGSLGLELPLARLLTELHGGTLTARSRDFGPGSSFILELPTQEEDV